MQINFNAHGAENQGLNAFLLILLAEICLVTMGHFVKFLTLSLDTMTVFVVVQVMSIVLLLPVILVRGVGRLRTPNIGLHSVRCVVGVTSMCLIFYAYQQLDLSLATLLKLLSPAFIPFAAVLVLGEKPYISTLVALAIALVGVAVSINIDLKESTHVYGVIAATLAALLAAFGKSLVRRIGRNEGADVIAFYFACFGALLSVPVWLLQGGSLTIVMGLSVNSLWLLLLVASLATLGQYTATVAYTKHRAAVVGLFTYMALPIAGVIGVAFWGDQISNAFLLGSALILMAGLIGSSARLTRTPQQNRSVERRNSKV